VEGGTELRQDLKGPKFDAPRTSSITGELADATK
jgi:hypothetical protein